MGLLNLGVYCSLGPTDHIEISSNLFLLLLPGLNLCGAVFPALRALLNNSETCRSKKVVRILSAIF